MLLFILMKMQDVSRLSIEKAISNTRLFFQNTRKVALLLENKQLIAHIVFNKV